MTKMNDSEKVNLYLECIYKYKDDVYRIIRNVFMDDQLSEDLTQIVMMNAWKSLHTLKDVKKSKAWLKAITRNVIRASMKKKNPVICVEENDLVNDIENNEALQQLEKDIVDIIIVKEEYALIGQALRNLDPIYQMIIREHVVGEIPLKEIAVKNDIKYGTIRVMYSRGLRILKEEYLKLEKGGGLNG